MKMFFLIYLLLCSQIVFSQSKDGVNVSLESKSENKYFFDPFAYKYADSAFYLVSKSVPLNQTARYSINRVSSLLDQNYRLDDIRVEKEIDKLEEYKSNNEIREYIKLWALRSAEILRKCKNSDAELEGSKELALSYKKGNFRATVELGRQLLLKYPLNLDMRSNYALALIHLNKDLSAELNLRTIISISDSNSPAKINLITVLEKIGVKKEAERLAFDLAATLPDHPIALYNAAWYKIKMNDYFAADSLLDLIDIEDKSISETFRAKFTELNQINKMLEKDWLKSQPLYKGGIYNKYDIVKLIAAIVSENPVTFAVIVFIIIWVIFWKIVNAIFGKIIRRSKLTKWLFFIFFQIINFCIYILIFGLVAIGNYPILILYFTGTLIFYSIFHLVQRGAR